MMPPRGALPILLCLFATAGGADTKVDLARAEAYALDGDFAPAWCIWEPLARDGNVTAQYNLGWLYRNGNGVAANDERARQLWEGAAHTGHAEAQMALAMLYGQEGGPLLDRKQAVYWYREAAAQGIEDALLVLLDYADRGNLAATEAVDALLREERVGKPVVVTVDKANVRAQPTTSGRVLATLPEGSQVRQLAVSGDWRRVWVSESGTAGWMFHSLFE
ncbi:MAG TPA: SH3 domain-containing protein [Gammaproteobacteria bacterium]|nr:SH3 domain-containing protein [Gammaproteobacteria bacterium]